MFLTPLESSGLWLAPYVAMSRLPIVWLETLDPNPAARVETNRMVAEKLAAAGEGLLAAQAALAKVAAATMLAAAFGRPPPVTPRRAARAVVRASLAPAAKRVRANARRLSRPRV